MFIHAHFDGLRRKFAEQFVPDGVGYLYRWRGKGPAVRISAEERERFVDELDRMLRWSAWITFGIAMLLAALISRLVPEQESARGFWWVWALVALVTLGFVVLLRRAWELPRRELARRPVVGEALPREVALRIQLARVGYRQLALGIFFGLVALVAWGWDHDLTTGWGPLVFVAFLLFTALMAWQGIRKYRLEKDARSLSTPK